MKTLVWGASFRRALKKAVRRDPQWRKRIADALDWLAADPFDPRLDAQTQRRTRGLVGVHGRVRLPYRVRVHQKSRVRRRGNLAD